MLDGTNGQPIQCVLVDLNTQRDFFEPDGASPVVGVEFFNASLRRVIAWAKRNQVPVVSSMDVHRSVEPSYDGAPKHCVEGTVGQSKLPFTLLPNRVFIAGDNTIAVPIDLFRRHQQVIFPQRSNDLFANPKADRFITQLVASEFILFGAIVEHEIKAVALGMLARSKSVTIITDGCGCWNPPASELSLRQMEAKGAKLRTVEMLLARKLQRRWRYTADSLVDSHRPNGVHRSYRDNGNGSGNGSRTPGV